MSHIHTFEPCEFKDYEKCTGCGSYHSIAQVEPKIIYEDNDYWDTGDGKTGRSTIEQQVSNFNCIDDCGISKADRIMQFVPDGKTALEIGCSPAVLLQRLIEKGYDAYGIEPAEKYIEFICNQAKGAKIIHGYFPEATKDCLDKSFDCILGIDVFEHFENYSDFINETYRLLSDGGVAIFMSPIILDDGDGFVRKRDFEPSQHCWIHSEKFLKPYLQEIFTEVKFANWINGHQLLILTK